MSLTPPRRAGAAALALLSVVALAGCGSSDKSSGGSGKGGAASSPAGLPTFDFTGGTLMGQQGVIVKLPDSLKKAMGSEASNLMVDSYTITPHPLDGAEFCAADVKPTYAPGGIDKVKQPDPKDDDKFDTPHSQIGSWLTADSHTNPMSALTSNPQMSGTYASDDGQSLVLVTRCSTSEYSDENYALLNFPTTDNFDFANFHVTFMKAGTITVIKSDVDGYTLDSNGNWIEG